MDVFPSADALGASAQRHHVQAHAHGTGTRRLDEEGGQDGPFVRLRLASLRQGFVGVLGGTRHGLVRRATRFHRRLGAVRRAIADVGEWEGREGKQAYIASFVLLRMHVAARAPARSSAFARHGRGEVWVLLGVGFHPGGRGATSDLYRVGVQGQPTSAPHVVRTHRAAFVGARARTLGA
eukprot:scaffold840_cov344-Pavlova_lutheri.AAC.77